MGGQCHNVNGEQPLPLSVLERSLTCVVDIAQAVAAVQLLPVYIASAPLVVGPTMVHLAMLLRAVQSPVNAPLATVQSVVIMGKWATGGPLHWGCITASCS